MQPIISCFCMHTFYTHIITLTLQYYCHMSSEVIPSQVKQQNSSKSSAAPTDAIKKSKRRWTRQEKEAQREWRAQNPQSQHPSKPKKPKKAQLSATQKLIHCAQRARFTGSVTIIHQQQQQLISGKEETTTMNDDTAQEEEPTIKVSTFCQKEPAQTVSPPFHLFIHVQPLLILDLNGILCHRIRHDNKLSSSQQQQQQRQLHYRPVTAHIANTDIVPRVDCADFLEYLDANFCLAVWTSAKPKTAKQLVSLLFPQKVQERLLFTWTQSKCLATPNTQHDKKKVLFQKPLNRVWKEFPLWNESNTFLMDDSTHKCTLEFSSNTLHPPPLDGKQYLFPLDSKDGKNNAINNKMSDLENEQLQLTFFQQLVQEIDTMQQQQQHGDLLPFLELHGRGHMGWRGPSVACTNDGWQACWWWEMNDGNSVDDRDDTKIV